MTDIITQTSNGRVLVVADTVALGAGAFDDRYIVTEGGVVSHLPLNALGVPVTLVDGVTGVPSDLAPGYNYNYVSGAFTASGVSPPAPPTISPWVSKKAIAPNSFIAIVASSIGAAAYNRLETDPASSAIWGEVITSSLVDPNATDAATNQNDFQVALAYLQATNGANGSVLLTSANVTAIIAAWPNT